MQKNYNQEPKNENNIEVEPILNKVIYRKIL